MLDAKKSPQHAINNKSTIAKPEVKIMSEDLANAIVKASHRMHTEPPLMIATLNIQTDDDGTKTWEPRGVEIISEVFQGEDLSFEGMYNLFHMVGMQRMSPPEEDRYKAKIMQHRSDMNSEDVLLEIYMVFYKPHGSAPFSHPFPETVR